jgi:hypothetical protein
MGFSNYYRTIPESKMVEILMLAGSAYTLDSPQALTTTREALNRWIAMGLEARLDRSGERLFDPVEVINFLKQAGLDGRDSFWSDRYVSTGRRLVSDLMTTRRQHTVDFKRTFVLGPMQIGKSLRLRAPLPLVSLYGDTLKVEPFLDCASPTQLQVSNGRLEARLVALNACRVTLGARLTFSSPTASPTSDQPNKLPYLRPREGLIVVTDRVRTLAHALAGAGASAAAMVRAFWTYMMDELNCGAIHYDRIQPDAPCDCILETGWYDCQLGAALLVALCRARAIPARLVHGYFLYHRAPTNHCWAEVWFDETGWTPFDFLSWDLSLGGRDAQWRDRFYGDLDDRMVTQILPFDFTGALGVPVPEAWHHLQTAKQTGVEICLAAVTGEPVYVDFVSIA